MSYRIQLISDRFIWEKFNLSLLYPSIFQSWDMGEANIKSGEKTERLGFYQDNNLLGIAQVNLVFAKRGRFIHLRGGPGFHKWTDFPFFLKHLTDYALKKNVVFIRISPPILKEDTQDTAVITQLGFKDVPIPLLDAEVSWILDLDKNEDELLMKMRKTTRYLIRKARKLGVVVTKCTNNRGINKLLTLYQKMVREKGIVAHKGILEEFQEFQKRDQAVIFLGSHQDQVLGAALILFYGDEAIYHHSAHIRNEIPVSYLMQWEAIKEAKLRGKKVYNFWGIEPTGNLHHPWAGLSAFKKGFGGNIRQFIRAKDYVLSPLYLKTWVIESLVRIRRYKTLK